MPGNQTVEVDSNGVADGLYVGDSYDVVVPNAVPLLEIRNAKDVLMANALVKVWGSDEPEGQAEFLKSDSTGVVRVRTKPGDTLRVRVLVRGTPYEQPTPVVEGSARLVLKDAKDAPLANTLVRVWGSDEAESKAETLKSDAGGVVRVGAKPGGTLRVRVLAKGTAHAQPTPAPTPTPTPTPTTPSTGCTRCDTLESLIKDNSVASKIKRKSTDKAAVKALQQHLSDFGYSLGSWGVDGDYGDATAVALTQFIGETKTTLTSADSLSAANARTVIAKCAAGFRRESPAQTPPPPAPEPQPQPEPVKPPGKCAECDALNKAVAAASGGVVCQKGGKNKDVITVLQHHLMKFRISLGSPDGDYGGKTVDAMKVFMKGGLKMSTPTPDTFSTANAREMIRLCSEGYKEPAPPQPTRSSEGSKAQTKVRSSYIKVGQTPFVKWYNDSFVGPFNKKYPTNSGMSDAEQKKIKKYHVGKINESAFRDLFDYIPALVDKNEISINEFVGHFFIMCREIGWGLKVTSEKGEQKYLFEAPGSKTSYNGYAGRNPSTPSTGSRVFKDQRFAGIQLKEWGVITNAADVNAWNSRTTYPATAPAATAANWKAGGSKSVNPLGLTWDQVKERAKECDFNKFRGRGLNQTTWRENYVKYTDDILVRCFGKNADQMTNAELDSAFNDRRVYSAAFMGYCINRAKTAIAGLDSNPPQWKPYSKAVLNNETSADIFHARCTALLKEMKAAGYEFK